MAKKSTPVWIQRPDETAPVIAGTFSWLRDSRVGEFTYDRGYLGSQSAISLDPIKLRFRKTGIKEVRQDGIFGVFRDAGPDAWGRDQLYRAYGDLDEFDCLLKGPADGVGNVSFGETPRSLAAYSLVQVDEVSAAFPPDDARLRSAVLPTTSMGGAKPKLLVKDDGAYWIAKFPEKGDPLRFLAANEHVMLEMARECGGIDAAHSRVHSLPDGRQILLVRRFDLTASPEGDQPLRKGFASAHTVLGLGDARTDAQKKSYLRLAEEMQRWTGQHYGEALWRRIAFNAMVSNIDDHPRNHAVIRDATGWQLSPAFDIVASAQPAQVALCMRFHEEGAVATPETLQASARLLGVNAEEAIIILRQMAENILDTWRQQLAALGAEPENITKLEPAFKVARAVLQHEFCVPPAGVRRSRYRRGF